MGVSDRVGRGWPLRSRPGGEALLVDRSVLGYRVPVTKAEVIDGVVGAVGGEDRQEIIHYGVLEAQSVGCRRANRAGSTWRTTENNRSVATPHQRRSAPRASLLHHVYGCSPSPKERPGPSPSERTGWYGSKHTAVRCNTTRREYSPITRTSVTSPWVYAARRPDRAVDVRRSRRRVTAATNAGPPRCADRCADRVRWLWRWG